MANEVVTKGTVFGGNVSMVRSSDLAAGLADSAANNPRGAAAAGMKYINFSGKRGIYEMGQDKDNIDPNELWLINISAFEDGWICWKGGQVLATRLYPLGTPVPPVNHDEHGPFDKQGDGWSQIKTMTLRSFNSGEQGYFKNNSVSGVSVFADLQKTVLQRIRAGQPSWPVVSLSSEKFVSKGFTNYKPVITIKGWISDDQVAELAEVFDDEEAEIDLEQMYLDAAGLGDDSPTEGDPDEDEDEDEAEEAEVVEEPKKAAAAPANKVRRRRAAL